MRIELTSAFTTLAVSEGTLQNVSRLAQIEVSSTQTENTGIVLNPGDILQFKSDVTLYARAVWKNAEPTEKVFLAHEPFKGKGEGGDNVLTYKGSVETYDDLPSTHNVGDVYNIETADETHGILAGDNVAWNGTSWDRLAGIYAIMQGATSSAAGKAGLAPAPAAGAETKVLFGDGTYKDISQVPLGAILTYSANANTPPPGFLYCEGQAISRTMYPDLFALIGTTYGAGDGSTTFNLPNLIGKYPQGATTAGTVKAAGLPNITGQIYAGQRLLINSITDSKLAGMSGAFSNMDAVTENSRVYAGGTETSGTSQRRVRFDASRSSSIYGNSDTVTPPTLTVRWIIKAYDAPTPSSAQIDLSQYASALAKRLTREQTPAFNKRDVITASGTYTAPVTGWYKITVKGGGGGGRGGSSNGTTYQLGGAGGGEGGTTIGFEKMTAGDTASVIIGAGGTGGAVGAAGSSGGDSKVTVNSTTYTGGGGIGGATAGGAGGTGTIRGAVGGARVGYMGSYASFGITGASGGGADGTQGGGGSGGSVSTDGVASAGVKGGNGYCWFEYFDPSLN